MKHLTFDDLVKQGLQLTKEEALKLQPHISKISQHGTDGLNVIEFEKGSQHTAEDVKQHNSEGQANNVTQAPGFEVNQTNTAPAPAPANAGNNTPPPAPVQQKKLAPTHFRGEAGVKLKAEGYKVGDMYPRLEEQHTAEEETEAVTVDQDFLDKNPQLVADGVKIGDVINMPKKKDQEVIIKQEQIDKEPGMVEAGIRAGDVIHIKEGKAAIAFTVDDYHLDLKPFWLPEGATAGQIINVPIELLEEHLTTYEHTVSQNDVDADPKPEWLTPEMQVGDIVRVPKPTE